ncbi:MAG: type II toxin-antitoxin system PemK/MazF family toxin [Cytophagales bacterium]|nr:type II toxin-antitoxin system PemK/MazF family toxin [Cytophagales bacterium]
MTFDQWDIILVPFPFTNLSTSKKRPALVVSPKTYNEGFDLVLAFITSQVNVQSREGDYKIVNWKAASLPKPSMIRMKFATIDKSIVVKKLGHLGQGDIAGFRTELINFFS